ncbi:hypothetical protein [Rhizomonospora bruguierae]|uniref:hypothetical protein n=1 Tax=Rhizomonospora bruguierae TaxID=1581705 RepID=UPI001BCBBD53|nr:hypothetical protein [Micromonospora sp. NBRC 107566]
MGDSFEYLAARCDTAAAELMHEAENAKEILASCGYSNVDWPEWAAHKVSAATAARGYAAGLRAEAAERGPDARPDASRLAQAKRVALAAEMGGILVDSRPTAQRTAEQANALFGQADREAWEAGTHPSQQKAREIEATGVFMHVAETIDGVQQVPFWRLSDPADQATTHRTRENADTDEF